MLTLHILIGVSLVGHRMHFYYTPGLALALASTRIMKPLLHLGVGSAQTFRVSDLSVNASGCVTSNKKLITRRGVQR